MNYNLEPLESAIAANDKISTTSLSDELVRALYHQPSSFTIAMMEKLMVDSVVTWAKQYKVDGFRFDLMGQDRKSVV